MPVSAAMTAMTAKPTLVPVATSISASFSPRTGWSHSARKCTVGERQLEDAADEGQAGQDDERERHRARGLVRARRP